MNEQFEHMQKLAFGKPLTESKDLFKNKIKELVANSLGEAKKGGKKSKKDTAPQEDVDLDIDTEETAVDTISPDTTASVDIDPKVKAIQDSLQKALANAKALGDEKLVAQIGNTITMLVRTQVLGAQNVAESNKKYYKDAEADDAEHIDALKKDMKDDKKLSENDDDFYESADYTQGYEAGLVDGYNKCKNGESLY